MPSPTDSDWFTAPINMQRVLTTPYEAFPTNEIKVWQGKPPVPTTRYVRNRRGLGAWLRDELPGVLVLVGTVGTVSYVIAQFVGA